MSGHAHDHDHEHGRGMSVYEFFGLLISAPLDDTLRFNVCDPDFWAGIRSQLRNERTFAALTHLDDAVAAISNLSETQRAQVLDAEYRRCFCGDSAQMPPCESLYGPMTLDIAEFARYLGVEKSLFENLPADHIANEIHMLAPIDSGLELSKEQMGELAAFFEAHPLSLTRKMLAAGVSCEEDTGFYRAIIEFVAGWLQWDLDAFDGVM